MATIKDVAQEAGLTVTTVSRVLNNRGYISERARIKVYEAMKKLNYSPNEVARSLQRKSGNTIGVIVPHIRHPYFSEMISNLEHEAYKLGYRILLCNTQAKEEREKAYLDICAGNRVAGIILFSAEVSAELFTKMEIPVITMERLLEGGTAAVECDNRNGGALAAEKLIEDGCKKILLIGSNQTQVSMPADERSEGFLEVCKRKGVSVLEVRPNQTEYERLDYFQSIEHALTQHRDIDGIFASSDLIAAQCIQVCREQRIAIPQQMKIIGFDDVTLAALLTPPLTTVHQPIKEMACMAVKLLKDAAEGKIVAKQTILPITLVERETT